MIHILSEAGRGEKNYNNCLCINLMSLKGSYLEISYSLTIFLQIRVSELNCKSQDTVEYSGTNQIEEKVK